MPTVSAKVSRPRAVREMILPVPCLAERTTGYGGGRMEVDGARILLAREPSPTHSVGGTEGNAPARQTTSSFDHAAGGPAPVPRNPDVAGIGHFDLPGPVRRHCALDRQWRPGPTWRIERARVTRGPIRIFGVGREDRRGRKTLHRARQNGRWPGDRRPALSRWLCRPARRRATCQG